MDFTSIDLYDDPAGAALATGVVGTTPEGRDFGIIDSALFPALAAGSYLVRVSGSFTSEGPALVVGTVAAIPIPGAVWLFGSGVLGLLGVGYTRRRKAAA